MKKIAATASIFVSCLAVTERAGADETQTLAPLERPGAVYSPLGPVLRPTGESAAIDLGAALFVTRGCTMSLIGPRTVLTAAHCVDAKNLTDLREVRNPILSVGGVQMTMACEMAPAYSNVRPSPGGPAPRSDANVALCHLPQPITISGGGGYEWINIESTPQRKQRIIMVGYGCRPMQIIDNLPLVEFAADNFDGVFRAGADFIEDLSPNGDRLSTYSIYPQIPDPHLCPGDSGGPAFLSQSDLIGNPSAPRAIVGVNSSIGYFRKKSGVSYFSSNISSLSTIKMNSFIRNWSMQHGAQICGLNITDEGGGCRPRVDFGRGEPESPRPE